MSSPSASRRSQAADRARAVVLLVGEWSGIPPASGEVRAGRMVIQRASADPRQLKQAIAALRPAWLLVGQSLDERTLRSLVPLALAMRPDMHVAMLGSTDDLLRCERWMRRGCHVYLDASSAPARVASVLSAAHSGRLIVIDRVFPETAWARRLPPVDSLTPREDEVLQLLRCGLRNADIAAALHLTESTVEFHVSRLLAKLGARNRLEAVNHAIALGLS
jgi:DNA-binding NarL/FixJ family response regulator